MFNMPVASAGSISIVRMARFWRSVARGTGKPASDFNLRHDPFVASMGTCFSAAWRLRVTGCLRDYVGITTGVPQIADDLLQRPSRQSRATRRHTSRGATSALKL